MANLMGFIDETGVLQKDPNQRLFGLGFLRMEHTAPFYQELTRLKDKILSKLTHPQHQFEFKFHKINRVSLPFYCDLLELYFSFPKAAFTAFVIDKQSPGFQMEKFYGDVWEAYIGYSKLVVTKNIGPRDKICILADHLCKPKASSKFYEIEVARAKGRIRNPVYNACMLESHASLFIQVADVLVGCVVFDFRMKAQPSWSPNPLKLELVKLLRTKLGVDSLANKLEKNEPNRFTVWPFKMG